MLRKHYDWSHKLATPNNLPSKTIPDQALPIKTMLDRHARGLPLVGNSTPPQYFGETHIPDINRMDFADRETYLRNMGDVYNAHKSALEAEKKRKEAEDKRSADEALRAKIKAELEAEMISTNNS